jgi:hypothetical protein
MPLLKSEVYEEAKSADVLNAEEVERKKKEKAKEAGGRRRARKKIIYVP